MEEWYVATPERLTALCQVLAKSRWLALDTEFIRDRSYYPKLCLVQVCNGELAAAIDVVALPEWEALLDLLYRPDITKVFHAARQDLEILQQLRGVLPTPLFDTQTAAALLGHGEQLGYGELVERELGVVLEKGQGRTDWLQRPLSPQQLRYALDDVIYLARSYRQMVARLAAQGRLEWLAEEFAALADPTGYVVEPLQAWRKVKGRNRLRGHQLAVLQQLAAWREEQAQTLDRPRKWVLRDELLVDLARLMPSDLAALHALRGVDAGLLERYGELLLVQIRQGRALPRGEWPQERGVPPRLSEQQQAQVDLLAAVLRLEVERQGIHPQAVAGRRELERLLLGEPTTLLQGWRAGLVGRRLQALLNGELTVAVVAGEMQLLEHNDGTP